MAVKFTYHDAKNHLLRKMGKIPLQEIRTFRNKMVMKDTAIQAGIPVPRYAAITSRHFLIFLNDTKFPFTLKPKDSVSSEGIIKINSGNDLASALEKISVKDYECEEVIDGKIYHVDGLVYKNNIVFSNMSESRNSSLTAIMNDSDFEVKVKEYTANVLRAFSLNNSAFHLEFVLDKNGTLFFLDIGTRMRSEKMVRLFEKLFGINLIHVWIDIQLEKDISTYINPIKNKSVGRRLLFSKSRKTSLRQDDGFNSLHHSLNLSRN